MKCRRFCIAATLLILLVLGCSSDDEPDTSPDAGPTDVHEDTTQSEDASDVESADTDDTNDTDDTTDTADTNDTDDLSKKICPEDGSFDHYEPGSCVLESEEEQSASNCPAGNLCLPDAHCVGQGGGLGPTEDCRILDCGVIDCAQGCTCVEESICVCPDD